MKYANELHEALSDMPLGDAIRTVRAMIEKHGYYAVRNDPGVRAWVADNEEKLRPIAEMGRQARQQANRFE